MESERNNVIFIQKGPDGPIRIVQSKKPDSTLEKTQQYNFEDLVLLAVAKGAGGYTVQRIRSTLTKEALGRDWYEPSNRLLAMIKHVQTSENHDLYGYIQEKFYGRKVKRRPVERKSKASKIKLDKTKVKDRLQREIEAGTLTVRNLDDD